ncbi:MAG: NYN domain-containing protein [Pigmentiphaga sp.]|nr:NYN domain-containing protein [Pigmentiphaga sp.]
MASSLDHISMALFCDFENVALGVRDANYEKFDINLVLEKLLLKGSIVVKKAYCDWERYKSFKGTMHEANFELIEIPHVRQSGKNSADIRLVVDALDLCYTKSHVNTFVIISGDSDFSPLVSKLRENDKKVIGVGVKRSTSDLLVANCDEFIFYDDFIRAQSDLNRKENRPAQNGQTKEDGKWSREELERRRDQGVRIAVETFEDLIAERGDAGKIWASALKDAIKRRRPDFNETYYGFRAFGNLLDAAQKKGLLAVGRDDKSGSYVYRASDTDVADFVGTGPAREPQLTSAAAVPDAATAATSPKTAEKPTAKAPPKPASASKTGGRRGGKTAAEAGSAATAAQPAEPQPVIADTQAAPVLKPGPEAPSVAPATSRSRGARKTPAKDPAAPVPPVAAPAKRGRAAAKKTRSRPAAAPDQD